MKDQPIGVFDSGLGGLTAVRELMAMAPNEQIVYLGDTARVPYGGRSKETIVRFAAQDLRFLLRQRPKIILVACGTVSATALEELRGMTDTPIIGVVEPACAAAIEGTKNGKIAVLGTKATIRSGAYEREMKRQRPEIEVIGKACPLFVPLVENGYTQREHPVTRMVARMETQELMEKGVDTAILGCTHFPILQEILQDMMPGVRLVNSGAEAAKAVLRLLGEKGLLSRETERRAPRFYATDDIEGFRENGRQFLGSDEMESVFLADLYA